METDDAAAASTGPPSGHRLTKGIAVTVVAVSAFLGVTLVTGFPPLHLASASQLTTFRDRINTEAASMPQCAGVERTSEQTHPAEVDWLRRQIRLRHAPGEPAWIPATLRETSDEKRMLPSGGPVLAAVGCGVAG